MDIRNKTILVTGAASGLGAACVRRLSASGARVVGLDCREPTENIPLSSFFLGDVTKEQDVQRTIDACVGNGGLYGVVHCAGILKAHRVVSRQGPHPLDAFVEVIQVNLVGTFNVVRLAAAVMQQNPLLDTQERGVLILTSSVAAFDGQIGQAAYSASKGGVASMCLPLARELGSWGIRVVAIAPGIFETPMMAATPQTIRDSLLRATVFPNRFGFPDEFASLVRQIFENPMLNATVIRLDGGLRMPPK